MPISHKIAIIGRANVGKSTLFNRLISRNTAITSSISGTTRDFNESVATIGDCDVTLIDTAGWEFEEKDVIADAMRGSTSSALDMADLILFVIDGKAGISSGDIELSSVVRNASKPTLLVINKSEAALNLDQNDLYKLGFGEPVYISAEHKLGFQELYLAIIDWAANKIPHCEQNEVKSSNADFSEILELPDARETLPHNEGNISEQGDNNSAAPMTPMRTPVFALIGRPNVGKSTLFNNILGHKRSIISDQAGTTRDVVKHDIDFQGNTISFLDTAGLRKKSKITEHLEELSVEKTKHSIQRSSVLGLVLSAPQMLDNQDLAIAQLVIESGRGLVIIINKCDLITDIDQLKANASFHIKKYLSAVHDVPILYTCGLTDSNVALILSQMQFVYEKWQSSFSTGQLNRWLQSAVERHNPPKASNNRSIKLKYIVQTRNCPPTFTIFTNANESVNQQYEKYLTHSFSEKFRLSGTPIKLVFKKTKNPYANKTDTKSKK